MIHEQLKYEYFTVPFEHILELANEREDYQAACAELLSERANKDKRYRAFVLGQIAVIEDECERELARGLHLSSLGRDYQVSDIFAKIFRGEMPTQPASQNESHYDAGVDASDADLARLSAHSVGQDLTATFVPSSYAAQEILGRTVDDLKTKQIVAAARKEKLKGSDGRPAEPSQPAAE